MQLNVYKDKKKKNKKIATFIVRKQEDYRIKCKFKKKKNLFRVCKCN